MARGNAKRAGKKKADKTPRPKKKPENRRKEAKKKAAAKRKKRAAARSGATPSSKQPTASRFVDPSVVDGAEAHFLQPYQATKAYLCPGCNREIPAGMGHMVSVPPTDPDLRRHWHRACWNLRHHPA